jgi:hypothetical protein
MRNHVANEPDDLRVGCRARDGKAQSSPGPVCVSPSLPPSLPESLSESLSACTTASRLCLWLSAGFMVGLGRRV